MKILAMESLKKPEWTKQWGRIENVLHHPRYREHIALPPPPPSNGDESTSTTSSGKFINNIFVKSRIIIRPHKKKLLNRLGPPGRSGLQNRRPQQARDGKVTVLGAFFTSASGYVLAFISLGISLGISYDEVVDIKRRFLLTRLFTD